jgi:hypothetical protein
MFSVHSTLGLEDGSWSQREPPQGLPASAEYLPSAERGTADPAQALDQSGLARLASLMGGHHTPWPSPAMIRLLLQIINPTCHLVGNPEPAYQLTEHCPIS